MTISDFHLKKWREKNILVSYRFVFLIEFYELSLLKLQLSDAYFKRYSYFPIFPHLLRNRRFSCNLNTSNNADSLRRLQFKKKIQKSKVYLIYNRNMIFFSLQHATEIFHIFSCFSPRNYPSERWRFLSSFSFHHKIRSVKLQNQIQYICKLFLRKNFVFMSSFSFGDLSKFLNFCCQFQK